VRVRENVWESVCVWCYTWFVIVGLLILSVCVCLYIHATMLHACERNGERVCAWWFETDGERDCVWWSCLMYHCLSSSFLCFVLCVCWNFYIHQIYKFIHSRYIYAPTCVSYVSTCERDCVWERGRVCVSYLIFWIVGLLCVWACGNCIYMCVRLCMKILYVCVPSCMTKI